MSRIDSKFEALKQEGRSALVGFITAGDPDYERSGELIEAMCRGGVDVLELGLPFSDPTSDGPVIQRSSQRALKAGMSTEKYLKLIERVRREYQIPVIVFSYYNPILHYGAEAFANDAKIAGADGMLIVDLPPEESNELEPLLPDDFPLIRLIAPNTPVERACMIASGAGGFIYVISRTGVTGTGGIDAAAIDKHVGELRVLTDHPLCVGFGVSNPEQAAAVAGCADGVVIGSAFEKLIEDNLQAVDLPDLMFRYVRQMREAVQGVVRR